MAKRKKRRPPPEERVQAAKDNGHDIDFDYDEVTDVIRLTLDTVCADARVHQRKLKRVVKALGSVLPPAPKKVEVG